MKKISLLHYFLFAFIAVAVIVLSCTKKEINTITLQQPTAKFNVTVIDPYGFSPNPLTNYIDSNFYFHNTSDTGAKITYHWDFGDGGTSAEKNPKHSYPKRGSYKVMLTVSNDNKTSDTVSQILYVMLGQKNISLGESVTMRPVAIDETSSNEFVLLASSGYGSTFYLFQLDSLLKQKSMKTFPANYNLLSMKPANDGNYIFAGSTQSIDKSNELIKMQADGTLLWDKVLTAGDSYNYAAPTADGGYMVVGSRLDSPGTNNHFTVVNKTDANGNVQWQKYLNQEGMFLTNNLVIEPDGVVVAGIKGSNCMECDSILVIKINNNGNIVWKSTVFGGMNNFSWWNTSIAKLSNGNYAVTNGYTRGIFFFSPSGDFLDRRLAAYQIAGITSSADGNLFVLQSDPGNGNYIYTTKLTMDGNQIWYVRPDGRQKVSGGYSCCSTSWPITLQPLRNGGFMVTGYAVIYNITNPGLHTDILMMEVDEADRTK